MKLSCRTAANAVRTFSWLAPSLLVAACGGGSGHGFDTTAPTVVSVSPTEGATAVALESGISVSFSETMDCRTVNGTTFTLRDAGNNVVRGSVSCAGSSATFTPAEALRDGVQFIATLAKEVTDAAGNGLAADYSWAFTTRARIWAAPTMIEGNVTGDASDIQVAVGPDGHMIAVWSEWDGARGNIWANRYAPGAGWETAVLIESDDENSARDPKITINPNGDAMVVWSQGQGPNYRIWSNRYDAASGWRTAVPVEGQHALFSDWPSLAFDARGNAIAAWVQWDGTRYNLLVNRYSENTGWGSAEALESEDGHAVEPRVAMDTQGNAFVVWQQKDSNGRYNIRSRRYTTETGWETPVLLETDDSADVWEPKIVVDAGDNALVVWTKADGTLWSNRYTAGTGWGAPARIEPDNTRSAGSVELAMDGDGNAMAVWMQRDDAVDNIWASRYLTNDGWQAPVRLENDDTAHAYYPQVAMDASGGAMAVWYQGDGTRDNIWASRYRTGEGWSTPILLENDDSGDAYEPVIAVEASGNAITAWVHWDGTRNQIWAARFE